MAHSVRFKILAFGTLLVLALSPAAYAAPPEPQGAAEAKATPTPPTDVTIESTFCNAGSSMNNLNIWAAVPGDVLFMTNDGGGGAYGQWCHTATFYRHDGDHHYVIEALNGPGVVVSSADSFLIADRAEIKRSVNQNVDGYVVRNYALAQVGKPYSTEWCNKATRDKFYCSHLTWASFKDTYNIDVDSTPYLDPAGCDSVFPDDVYQDSDLYQVATGN